MIRAVARWVAFPLIFGGAFVSICVALQAGANIFVAVSCVNLAAAALIIAFEQLVPYRPSWNRSHGDVLPDAIHLVVTSFVIESLPVLVMGALGAVAATLSDNLGYELWPAHWPLMAQLALALFVAEIATYWLHRTFHRVPLLWRLHAVHHAAPRLYWLNSTRFHPLEVFIALFAATPLLILLGAGTNVLAGFGVIAVIHRMLQHANIDVRLGPLNWVFSMAPVHRWHHSSNVEEANNNYGAILLVWDVVFGTRFMPTDRTPPDDVGIEHQPALPSDYLGQLASPFRRTIWPG